jgi:transposase
MCGSPLNLNPPATWEPQTTLIAWPEVTTLFLPKYTCWLNVMELCWKELRSLARKGWRCECVEESIDAVAQRATYWRQHPYPSVWKKDLTSEKHR